jgi:RHS repeat-associated protein
MRPAPRKVKVKPASGPETTVQKLLYGTTHHPLAEVDAQGQVAVFVYGTRAHVPDLMLKGASTYRLITDVRGSVRRVVDSTTGTIVQRTDYDEFGNVLPGETGAGFQPFGFAGGLRDLDTGLVRFAARDYDPETGRWTNKDPIRFHGGDSNIYAYVANDPLNRIDPNGRLPRAPLRGWFCEVPVLGWLVCSILPRDPAERPIDGDGAMVFPHGDIGKGDGPPSGPEACYQEDNPDPDDHDDCKRKATDWELEQAGIEGHAVKIEIVGKKNISRYEICKCASGGFALKLRKCRGPIIERL